jgi:RNA polymerase sigma-70 factor (ECF subfamily)
MTGLGILVALLSTAARADEVSLASVPPVVVKTVPQAGAGDVDPRRTEIRVEFSKDMQDGSWSWSTLSKESFPKVTGKPKYLADKRTCVLPVKLEPGKTYAVWLNSENFGNFKDADGHSAVPYLLVFQTKR